MEGEISSPKALRESPRENRERSDQVVFVDAPSDSVGALGETVVELELDVGWYDAEDVAERGTVAEGTGARLGEGSPPKPRRRRSFDFGFDKVGTCPTCAGIGAAGSVYDRWESAMSKCWSYRQILDR